VILKNTPEVCKKRQDTPFVYCFGLKVLHLSLLRTNGCIKEMSTLRGMRTPAKFPVKFLVNDYYQNPMTLTKENSLQMWLFFGDLIPVNSV
jgi:hypothetical protein